MAGIEWDPALVEVVAGVEAELDVVVHGGDATFDVMSMRLTASSQATFAPSSSPVALSGTYVFPL